MSTFKIYEYIKYELEQVRFLKHIRCVWQIEKLKYIGKFLKMPIHFKIN